MRHLYAFGCTCLNVILDKFLSRTASVEDDPQYQCSSLTDEDAEKISAWARQQKNGGLLN